MEKNHSGKKKSKLTLYIFIALIAGITLGFVLNTNYVHVENKKIDGFEMKMEQINAQLQLNKDTASAGHKALEIQKQNLVKERSATLAARDKKVEPFALIADLFLRLIKMIVAPLVFTTLVVGVAKLGDIKSVGRIGGKTLLWFLGASWVSLFLGMMLVNIFKPGLAMHLPVPEVTDETGIAKASLSLKTFLYHVFPSSFVESMAANEILQIVVFSLFFGVATAAIGEQGKIVIKAMDAVQEMLKQEKQLNINGFIVTGASKRGWTTWLTAASGDKRVVAIAPTVIDNLNIREQMKYQVETWGAFSPSIRDYTDRNLVQHDESQASEFEKKLWAMIDPYCYRERLTMPKLLVHGTNDPYWTVDATKHYFDGLPGVKYILTLPNAGHGLDGQQIKAAQTAAAFAKFAAQGGGNWPTMRWRLDEEPLGYQIDISTDISPRAGKLWTATSETKDFRQAKWTSTSVEANKSFSVIVAKPESGHMAFFVELESTSDGLPFSLTTQVWRY
jgi:dienelactone hydrolase